MTIFLDVFLKISWLCAHDMPSNFHDMSCDSHDVSPRHANSLHDVHPRRTSRLHDVHVRHANDTHDVLSRHANGLHDVGVRHTTFIQLDFHDTLPRHPYVVSTTRFHDVLVFALHDVLNGTHDTHMFVPTTTLHDVLVLVLHDMLNVIHDIHARHATHDMVSPRHAKYSPRHAQTHVVGAHASMSWRFSSMSC